MRSWHLIAALGIDPDKLIHAVGLIGLFGVIFAESGLMIGFFLPGDSLLFTAGLLSATTDPPFPGPFVVVALGCFVAAVAGDQVGYAFGHKVGPAIFKKPDARLFKHEYVMKAEEFFEKHGSKTIILARFVPVVRTFAPILAGVSKMHYRTFVMYNVVGGFVWAVGFTALGYGLGQRFPGLGDKLDIVIPVIIVLSLLPVGIEFYRHRRRGAATAALGADEEATAGDAID